MPNKHSRRRIGLTITCQAGPEDAHQIECAHYAPRTPETNPKKIEYQKLHSLYCKYRNLYGYCDYTESGDAAFLADMSQQALWQPIETAPKNADIIIYANSGEYWKVGQGERRSGGKGWRFKGESSIVFPTHWMSLPEPPKE
ncbi:MAG: DUF551 domain-containing protein [Desulfovibrionaceae bacterium]|nr:DUF551 domain-containing protein [Desulfovibrionaceae bacterium]